jgi:hypothetical protein
MSLWPDRVSLTVGPDRNPVPFSETVTEPVAEPDDGVIS